MPASLSASLSAVCATVLLASTGAAQAQSYVGRWYVEDPAVCKGPAGDTEGLVVYGPRKMEGYEHSCEMTRSRAVGPRTEITMHCRGEGRTYIEKTSVEIVNGRLRQTFLVEGKIRSFDYRRCP